MSKDKDKPDTKQYQYHGQNVTVERDAKKGDVGFDSAKKDQVVVILENGTRQTVLRADLTSAG